MSRLALDVRDAGVAFGGVQALQDVSFEVPEGSLFGIIGPNGAGKTTLMRIVTGQVKADSGEVLLRGKRLTGLSVHARMRAGLAISQQLVRPFRAMTFLDNVALAAGHAKTRRPLGALLKVSRKVERDKAAALLELTGIADARDRLPGELPFGYLKRLEMARALALEPKLLLLDEPLAGLNHAEAARLAETILDLKRGGLTILLIEHNLREVARICEQLLVLDNGHTLATGSTDKVLADAAVREAYVGSGKVGREHAPA